MRLYWARGSSSLSARIALNEAGLPFATEEVDEHAKTMAGGGDYRSINPLGYLPALQFADGTCLTEGVAIMQLIADKAPDKKLAPPNGTIERARLQAWLNFLTSELHKSGFSPLFNPAMPETGKQIFRARIASRLGHLDNHLATNTYLLGPEYSIADAHCFVITSWAPWVKVDLQPFANVRALRERIASRPAVQASLQAENLIPWPASAP